MSTSRPASSVYSPNQSISPSNGVPRTALDATQPGTDDGLSALLEGIAVAPLTGPGWLRVRGEDRVRWLNGMLTNSIATLGPGEGVYTFALSAQGRIQADAYVFALGDELRIETNRPAELMLLLDRFIIMDDVELTPLPAGDGAEYRGLLVAGPQAHVQLDALFGGLPSNTVHKPYTWQVSWNGQPVDVVHAYSPLVERFELWASAAVLAELRQAMLGAGAVQAGMSAVEDLRLLEGTPLYGVDIRDKELPQETAQDRRALHFSKGCYLGQEIVERIRSRGSVHRIFCGFLLTGELPAPGTPLLAAADGAGDPSQARPAGEITSARAIRLPRGGAVQLALGYARRDMLERHQALSYAGGEARKTDLPWSELDQRAPPRYAHQGSGNVNTAPHTGR